MPPKSWRTIGARRFGTQLWLACRNECDGRYCHRPKAQLRSAGGRRALVPSEFLKPNLMALYAKPTYLRGIALVIRITMSTAAAIRIVRDGPDPGLRTLAGYCPALHRTSLRQLEAAGSGQRPTPLSRSGSGARASLSTRSCWLYAVRYHVFGRKGRIHAWSTLMQP